jgi:uncharacterized protein with beta-barrel porin domain
MRKLKKLLLSLIAFLTQMHLAFAVDGAALQASGNDFSFDPAPATEFFLLNNRNVTLSQSLNNSANSNIDLISISGSSSLTLGNNVSLVSSGAETINVRPTSTSSSSIILNSGSSIQYSQAGISLSGDMGRIENAGLITNNNCSSCGSYGIIVGANVTNGIINSGTIKNSGSGSAVLIGNASGDLNFNVFNNSGTITGGNSNGIGGSFGTAVNISTIGGNVTGNIINTGTIEGGDSLVSNNGSVFSVIGNGVNVFNGSITNGSATNSSATISSIGTDKTLYIASDITGGIINYGKITASDGSAVVYIDAGQSAAFYNAATGVILGSSATAFQISGSVDRGSLINDGLIKSEDSPTLYLQSGATFDFISNNGTIISTNDYAIQIDAGASITGSVGVNGFGINNSGRITALGSGSRAFDVGGQVTNGINNSGIIEATSLSQGSTAMFMGMDVGSLTNSGIISGGDIGLNIDVGNVVNNSGRIIGEGEAAIVLNSNNNNGLLTINNSGLIKAENGVAIKFDTLGDAEFNIVNSGTISAMTGGDAININANSSLSRVTFTNNGGVVNGNIFVFSQGTANAININGGVINGDIVGYLAGNININNALINGVVSGLSNTVINFGVSDSDISTVNGFNNSTVNVLRGTVNVNDYGGGEAHIITASGTNLNFTKSVSGAWIDTITVHGTASIASSANVQISIMGVGRFINIDGSGATLKFDVFDANNYAKLSIPGTLEILNGGSISVGAARTGFVADNTILTNVFSRGIMGANLTANDGQILADDSYIYKFTQVNNSSGGFDILVNRENSLASITGGAGVGVALENAGSASGLSSIMISLSGLQTQAQVASALKTLTPDVSGSNNQAVIAFGDAALGTVESHLEFSNSDFSASSLSFSKGASIASKGGSVGIWGSSFANPFSGDNFLKQNYAMPVDAAWGEIFNGSTSQSRRNGIDGYNANIAGLSFGADIFRDERSIAGLSFSYGQTKAAGTYSRTDIKTYQLSAYATRNYEENYVEGLAAIGLNRYDSSRTLFDGSVARSEHNGQHLTLKGTVGRRIQLDKTLLTPFASLQISRLRQDKYTESGSNADLTVDQKDIDMFKAGVGFKLASNFLHHDKLYTPRLSFGAYHDFAATVVDTTSTFVASPNSSFATRGATVAKDSFKFGAGIDILSQSEMTISLDYMAEVRQQYRAHTTAARIKWKF